MEEKINISEILKNKPNGIRLYSPIFGECAFSFVREETDDNWAFKGERPNLKITIIGN